MSNPIPVNRADHHGYPSEGHLIVWNSYKEFLRDAQGRLTSVVLWTDSNKTQKIREVIFARDVLHRVSSITKKAYDSTGTLRNTITMTVTRPLAVITGITVSRT